MRPGALVPIKWRLPECPRLILPFAVNLKRFLAPRWVFNFNFGFDAFLGIAGNPLDNFTVPFATAGGGGPPPPQTKYRARSDTVHNNLSAWRVAVSSALGSLLSSVAPVRSRV